MARKPRLILVLESASHALTSGAFVVAVRARHNRAPRHSIPIAFHPSLQADAPAAIAYDAGNPDFTACFTTYCMF